MKIVVMDAQGGGIGRQLTSGLKEALPEEEIFCVGTNSLATSAMLKAGADGAATGENAVLVACRHADVVVGPLGIVIADSLGGEITPAMATAVAQSDAARILIPFAHCRNTVIGVGDYSAAELVRAAVKETTRLVREKRACAQSRDGKEA